MIFEQGPISGWNCHVEIVVTPITINHHTWSLKCRPCNTAQSVFSFQRPASPATHAIYQQRPFSFRHVWKVPAYGFNFEEMGFCYSSHSLQTWLCTKLNTFKKTFNPRKNLLCFFQYSNNNFNEPIISMFHGCFSWWYSKLKEPQAAIFLFCPCAVHTDDSILLSAVTDMCVWQDYCCAFVCFIMLTIAMAWTVWQGHE